ncbi:MAG TPA: phospholipase C, phosphocholine-specific [Pseudonocardiaceae bacterium]|jgi:phospholipase C|nr:phospholipase C, phosphocholine-specific [Pseudonocardiaceae bacterium]
MSEFTRRRFLGGAAAAGALSMLPAGMVQALAAPRQQGSLADVEHVVILMQENRSFDHYYGSMSGVRGFADRTAVVQPNGLDVFHQSIPGGSEYLLPYHVNTATVDGQDDPSLDHGWDTQHQAVADGANNGWIVAKTEPTMGYFTQADIPLHRALADAFTICDHYHCSIQGPTTPNRLYLFSGTVDAAGQYGGPAISNPPDYGAVYSWPTYPEFLEQLGVSWQVYANNEVGDGSDGWLGDYGDNPLWLFDAYHDPANATLAAKASVTPWQPDSGQGKNPQHVLSRFIADCKASTLPEVSWIVAPFGYCEHPTARPLNGQIYTQTVLNALWANQDLWSSTVLLITYDENDGLFDHVPPPIAPSGTADEYVDGAAIGLGVRVPMTVISPWSAGGWVNSQVFDHTSVIRFLESWKHPDNPFPNISAWRRSVCGDLTSCFDFGSANATVPTMPAMPTTAIAPGDPDDPEAGLAPSAPPSPDNQTPPTQDSGTRSARPIPYQPTVGTSLNANHSVLTTTFANAGTSDVQLAAYRADGHTDGPWQYLVAAGGTSSDTWNVGTYPGGTYGVAVHGPNRFLWEFLGNVTAASAGFEVTATYTSDQRLLLTMTNPTGNAIPLTVTANNYRSDGPWTYTVPANGSITGESWNLTAFDGWYDLSATVDNDPDFLRRFTGHYENGQPSSTG